MSEPFATIDDLHQLWRKTANAEETTRAEKLLQVVSDCLRAEAEKVGKDLDKWVQEKPYRATVARSVTVDVVARTLMTSTDQEPMTQMSQSAGGFSVSGTFLLPGGGIFIKRTELARLGLRRQRVGELDIYGIND